MAAVGAQRVMKPPPEAAGGSVVIADQSPPACTSPVSIGIGRADKCSLASGSRDGNWRSKAGGMRGGGISSIGADHDPARRGAFAQGL